MKSKNIFKHLKLQLLVWRCQIQSFLQKVLILFSRIHSNIFPFIYSGFLFVLNIEILSKIIWNGRKWSWRWYAMINLPTLWQDTIFHIKAFFRNIKTRKETLFIERNIQKTEIIGNCIGSYCEWENKRKRAV